MSSQDKEPRKSLAEIAAEIEARIAAEQLEQEPARLKGTRAKQDTSDMGKLIRAESGDKRFSVNRHNIAGKVSGVITLYSPLDTSKAARQESADDSMMAEIAAETRKGNYTATGNRKKGSPTARVLKRYKRRIRLLNKGAIS